MAALDLFDLSGLMDDAKCFAGARRGVARIRPVGSVSGMTWESAPFHDPQVPLCRSKPTLTAATTCPGNGTG
jgi:hypothetical protein